MGDLKRFGVSIESELLKRFDKHIKEKNYPTRSKAIGDLIRDNLVKKEWIEGKELHSFIIITKENL